MMTKTNGKPAKKESWRGVAVVGVLCAAFLWYWFTLDRVPDDAGPEGLAERCLAELKEQDSKRPLLTDFDLLEFSMLLARNGQPDIALRMAQKIDNQLLQSRALAALAQARLHVDTGSMAPALDICAKIPLEDKRQSALRDILQELAKLGLADAAWSRATTLEQKAAIIRVLAETDGKEEAKKRRAEIATQLPSDSPKVREDLAWTHLWLQEEEAALAQANSLPRPVRDELLSDLFRLVRLEHPERSKETLDKMPEELKIPLRIEAARLNGNLESPDSLIAELEKQAQEETEPPRRCRALLAAAKARWQISGEADERWKAPLQSAVEMAASAAVPSDQRAGILLEAAALQYDALDIADAGKTLLSARKAAGQISDSTAKALALADVANVAFRSSEPAYATEGLAELCALLRNASAPPEAAKTAAELLFRQGSWQEALDLLGNWDASVQEQVLPVLAGLTIESTAAPGLPVSQDKSLAEIRQVAQNQGETAAARMAMRLPRGIQRARSWLEIAKGLVVKAQVDRETAAAQTPAAGDISGQ
jgi:hypothetical protein